MEGEEGVLIVDDSISEKPYTDENEIICWHYDHTTGRTLKGINFDSALYHHAGLSLPVDYHLVAKTETDTDAKTGKPKRRSPITKNAVYQRMVRQAIANQIPFRYGLNDVWFASAENMPLVHDDLKREFVMPLKCNRKVALSLKAKQRGQYVRVESLSLEAETVMAIYVEAVTFPLLLVKQHFTNEDGTVAFLYLVTSDLLLTYSQITTLYRKRWNVEHFHKSLKQNVALAQSSTKTVTTQSNHLFASLCAYLKLEMFKRTASSNHFAFKAKLYLSALQSAFRALQALHPISLAA